MLVCKLIGAGLLLLCSLCFPRVKERERQEAVRQIDRLLTLVRFIRGKIAYFRIPVGEILKKCDGELLDSFGGRKESLNGLFAATDWRDGETGKLAEAFAAELGKGYFAEQLKLCDYTLGALEELRTKRTAGEEKKKKTERVLFLGGAAAIVILLL